MPMTAQTIIPKFEKVLGVWEKALDQYSDEEFARKPDPDSWSIGQVYAHLVRSALNYHLKQAEASLGTAENADKPKTGGGKLSYFIGGFLPVKVKVPPSDTYTPKQPAGKEAIREGLSAVRDRYKELGSQIDRTGSKGKTAHPFLGYLNAVEWFQLVEMHYRHHLRQKRRLDKFLKKVN